MTVAAGGLTHGGVSFMKSVLEAAFANGWTRYDDIGSLPDIWASAPVVQRDTVAVDLLIQGISSAQWIELPLMYLNPGSYTARLNGTTVAVKDTDFEIDEVRGRFRIIQNGVFDSNNDGFADSNARFTLDPGYELKRGYTILRSQGVSGTDDMYIGCMFDSQSGNPDMPLKTGPRWSAFATWSIASSAYSGGPTTFRNAEDNDVRQFIHPTFDYTWQATITADRIISRGLSACHCAWSYVGQLLRVRPQIEQPRTTAILGHTSHLDPDHIGPVGQQSNPGDMSSPTQYGSIWTYDTMTFASDGDPLFLNANFWSFNGGAEAAAAGAGYTPSRVVVNNAGVLGTPEYYFELHDVIAGKNNGAIADDTNILYGMWDGLKAVLIYGAKDNDQLTYNGVTYRLWSVGSKNDVFVAVEEA